MTLSVKGQGKARSTLVYLGDDVRQEVTLLPMSNKWERKLKREMRKAERKAERDLKREMRKAEREFEREYKRELRRLRRRL